MKVPTEDWFGSYEYRKGKKSDEIAHWVVIRILRGILLGAIVGFILGFIVGKWVI